MNPLEAISKNSYAFVGVTIILVLIVAVAFVSIGKPPSTSKDKGAEKILKINGADVIVFEGTGCECTADIELVCGEDGRTYFNQCFASCAEQNYTTGACNAGGGNCLTIAPGTLVAGQPCNASNLCAPGLACVDGTCTSSQSELPTLGEQCGSVQLSNGIPYWNPTACSQGLVCINGLCGQTASQCFSGAQCIDTDNGNYPATSGTTTATSAAGEQTTTTDRCEVFTDYQGNPGFKLTEFYCLPNNQIAQAMYDCENDCTQSNVCNGAVPT